MTTPHNGTHPAGPDDATDGVQRLDPGGLADDLLGWFVGLDKSGPAADEVTTAPWWWGPVVNGILEAGVQCRGVTDSPQIPFGTAGPIPDVALMCLGMGSHLGAMLRSYLLTYHERSHDEGEGMDADRFSFLLGASVGAAIIHESVTAELFRLGYGPSERSTGAPDGGR